ncbi:MAG: lactate racemase domain-containing protein [Thermoguttaceae bacterium]
MVFILPYGTDSSARLDLPEGILLAECGFPQRVPVDDLAAAVAAALAEPLDFPPLAQATTPCDCVVLPIAPGVPHAPCMIAAIVRTLLESGVKPDGITLLRTQLDVETDAPDPASDLPPELRAALTVRVHDPQDRAQLAYLAALDDGEPILLNRAITDADVVLPVGSISNRRADTYHGIHGTVYPTFSDHEALLRFRSPELLQHGKAEKKRLVKQCDQIGWLLGLNFTIQTVPGTGDEILHVLAGQSAAVRRKGRELYDEAWSCSVPRRAGLVVAAIAGGAPQQTWHNLGQALAAAGNLVEEDGAIALCCDLAAPPGPAIQKLRGARSREKALRTIHHGRSEDALAAVQLTDALARGHVYLLSRLEPSLVEDLNMVPLSDPQEISRLAQRYGSCILLANALHAVVKTEE